MKVECAACQAKYQIPDERVAGRKLKIRCRKCGGAIVVRGDQLAPPEAAAEPQHAGYPSGEWHVSLEGEQHGPYAVDQMASMLREGQLAWDAHVWREGYADWKTAGDSDTIVRAVASAHDTSSHQDTPATGVVHGGFEDEATRMMQSLPPSEALQPVARSTFAARAAQKQSQPPHAGLAAVGRPMSQPPQSQPPQVYAAAEPSPFAYADPRVSAEASMTGERHEDSVLFSTRNLQTSQRNPSSPALQQRAGYAGGEGSGLIDIRALAALARSSQAPSAHVPATTNGASASNGAYANGHGRDEVMALAHQGGAFARLDSIAPLDRPVRASSNAVPIAIVAGSALVAMAAFLAVYMTRGPAVAEVATPGIAAEPALAAAAQPTAVPGQPALGEPEPVAAEPAAAEPETAKAEEPAAAAEEADEAEPAEEEAKADTRSSRKASGKRASARSSKSTARAEKAERAEKPVKPVKAEKAEKAAAEKEAPAKKSESIDDLLLADAKPAKEKPAAAATPDDNLLAAPAPKKATSNEGRSIDDLLDGAVDKNKPKPEASAASAALADSPSRDEVKSAMKGVEADVKACAEGQTLDAPSATVSITVSGSTGRVSGVRVTGIQGSVGTCIARAVRGASFPKFAKSQFSINFPFRLK